MLKIESVKFKTNKTLHTNSRTSMIDFPYYMTLLESYYTITLSQFELNENLLFTKN